jgi:hypothetical protein
VYRKEKHNIFITESQKRLILDEEIMLKNILTLFPEASIIFEDDGRGGEDRARYDTWNDKVRRVEELFIKDSVSRLGNYSVHQRLRTFSFLNFFPVFCISYSYDFSLAMYYYTKKASIYSHCCCSANSPGWGGGGGLLEKLSKIC